MTFSKDVPSPFTGGIIVKDKTTRNSRLILMFFKENWLKFHHELSRSRFFKSTENEALKVFKIMEVEDAPLYKDDLFFLSEHVSEILEERSLYPFFAGEYDS